jgi:hypothetical protein
VVSARRIVESPVVPLTIPAVAWSNAVPAGPGSQQPQSSLLSVPQTVDDLPVRPLPHAWSAGPAPAPARHAALGDPALRPGQNGRSGPDFGAVGKGAKHASLSIAGFFTRAGRSIADSF